MQNEIFVTLSSSRCKSHTGKLVTFANIDAFRSAKHFSNVDVALNPITENTTTPANIDVPQFVNDTSKASR